VVGNHLEVVAISVQLVLAGMVISQQVLLLCFLYGGHSYRKAVAKTLQSTYPFVHLI
jgi:hypothetical protein